MWFCSLIIIILSATLLRGNYAALHGKVFDSTDDKEGYAKAIGKPAFLLGCGMPIVGILAIALQGLYLISVAVAFLLLSVIVAGLWFLKFRKDIN